MQKPGRFEVWVREPRHTIHAPPCLCSSMIGAAMLEPFVFMPPAGDFQPDSTPDVPEASAHRGDEHDVQGTKEPGAMGCLCCVIDEVGPPNTCARKDPVCVPCTLLQITERSPASVHDMTARGLQGMHMLAG